MLPISNAFAHRTSPTVAAVNEQTQQAEAGPSTTVSSGVAGRPRMGDVDQRHRNDDHVAHYVIALEQAARVDAGDGGKILSPAAMRVRKNMAQRLVSYMSERGIEAQNQKPEQLSQLKNEFLLARSPEGLIDGSGDNSRASMDSALEKYLDWRKNGLITIQQGVVIAITERQQAVAQGNMQSLRNYRVALQEQKNRQAGDGTTMISAAVAEERGVVASGYVQWMSINEHAVSELTPADLKARADEYVAGREILRKRKREGSEGTNTATSHVLANQVGKYLDWLHAGVVQKQRGVLTSQVEGSEEALQANRAVLEDYRAALKSAQSTPTPIISKPISAKTAQNRAGSASGLIKHLSDKGLNVRTLALDAMSSELDELYRKTAAKATKATVDKLKSDIGKFLEWRNHALQGGSATAATAFSQDQLACLESNAQYLSQYHCALRDAATPAPGQAAALIGENPRKHRGTTASAFGSWIQGNHTLESLDEDEWHGLKNDYLQAKFTLAEGAKPSSSWRSEESDLNKYIEWAITGSVSAQKGGATAAPTDRWAHTNTQRLSNYRNALATAAQTPAGDGGKLISPFVQQSRGAAAKSFMQWLSAKHIDSTTLDLTGLSEAMNNFIYDRYPGNLANREKLMSNVRPFVDWQLEKTVKPQRGVDIVHDRETQAIMEQNKFWLSRYHDSLTDASDEGPQQLSASALKNRKVQANGFTRYCSLEGHVLKWLKKDNIDTLSAAYLSNKLPEVRAAARSSLRPYLDWFVKERSVASGRSSPGLFVSDSE